jgi:hypothetical protein
MHAFWAEARGAATPGGDLTIATPSRLDRHHRPAPIAIRIATWTWTGSL